MSAPITVWTTKLVDAHLHHTASVLSSVSHEAIREYLANSPRLLAVFEELIEADRLTEGSTNLPKCISQEIRQCLEWLSWLEPLERKILWNRACGNLWKVIAHETGMDRTTAWRRMNYGLKTIIAIENMRSSNTSHELAS